MKRKTKRSKRFFPKAILFVILIIGIYFAWKQAAWANRPQTSGTAEYTTATPPVAQTQETRFGITQRSLDTLIFTVPVHIAEITDTRYLELVNFEYSINGEPDNGLIVSAWPSVPVRVTDITLHKTALEAVSELFGAANEAGIGSFYVSSGYRDYDTQKQVYNDMQDKSFAQPPNHSEHQAGLAADILAMGVLQSEMADSHEGQWLAKNAWKHGLVLRYTEEKRDITGIAGEPWHFRYIGHPHAWYCQQQNLCFEEYIQLLKENGGYRATLDGKTYSVLYQVPQNSIIYVPGHQNYYISGDNTGGFIITAWE